MKVKDVQARIVNGAILECVENTYQPKLNGTFRKVTKAQKQNYRCVASDKDGNALDAKPFWGSLPSRQSDIVAASADTVTFKMRAGEGHTLTLRFVNPSTPE
jgi:hypothetical protein